MNNLRIINSAANHLKWRPSSIRQTYIPYQQKGIVSLPLVHPVAEVVKNARALADAFRAHSLPVVLVNVAGMAPGRTEQVRRMGELPSGWTDLIPELNQRSTDHTITKHTPGAFPKTGLEEHLRKLGVTQVRGMVAPVFLP